jgi:probable F420-dependent oxidoreductase
VRVGLVFPRTQIGTNPGSIRRFAAAAEDLGYTHLSIEEHVLGADPDREGGWDWGPGGKGTGGYVNKDMPFSEPLVLAGFLAAATSRIEVSTAVLILPQRPAALVAKQVAELTILSEGRFRLGIGSGWNPVEFEGLGVPFSERGRRQEEQVRLMRELWTHDSVDFRGRFHRIDKAGINPLPRHPIPVWFGGNAEVAMRRAARLGDGWIPLGLQPNGDGQATLDRLRSILIEEGRDPAAFGIEVFYRAQGKTAAEVSEDVHRFEALGVSHVSLLIAPRDAENIGDLLTQLQGYRDTLAEFMTGRSQAPAEGLMKR